MQMRDGTTDDARFASIEVASYVSGDRLVLVVNAGAVCIARVVLSAEALTVASVDAVRRWQLPVSVTIGVEERQ